MQKSVHYVDHRCEKKDHKHMIIENLDLLFLTFYDRSLSFVYCDVEIVLNLIIAGKIIVLPLCYRQINEIWYPTSLCIEKVNLGYMVFFTCTLILSFSLCKDLHYYYGMMHSLVWLLYSEKFMIIIWSRVKSSASFTFPFRGKINSMIRDLRQTIST